MTAVLAAPSVDIEIDRQPLPSRLAESLAHVIVERALSVPSLCELTFLDPEGDATFALVPGRTLAVRIAGDDRALFVGEITAAEHVYDPSGGRALLVRGYDRLHRLRQRQAARVLIDIGAAELAADVGTPVGLRVGGSPGGPKWPRIVQHRQSDLELLVDIAQRSGLFLVVDYDELRLITLEGEGEPVVLVLGSSLIEATIELNGDRAVASVAATGWDMTLVQRHAGRAGTARSGRTATAALEPDRVGGGRELFDEVTPDDEIASSLAQMEFDVRTASEVVFRGVALGDARLRPGGVVDVENVDPQFAGRYVLTRVQHRVDRQAGLVCELSSEPPDIRPRRYGTIATAGVVRRVDDPDGLARVNVALPSFGDVETGWIPVASAGAGAGKGFVALPDTGDHVLVLLRSDDPAQAVVVGGLFGPDLPFDPGVVEARTRRYSLRSPGGHVMRFDDVERRVTMENSVGDAVDLSPDRVRLASRAALEIEAAERAVIRGGGDVAVHSGANVEIRAGAELTIHAGGDLVLEAPGRAIRIRAASVDFESA